MLVKSINFSLGQLFIAVKESDSKVIKESKLELLSKIEDQIDSWCRFEEVSEACTREAPNAKENGGKMPILATSDLSANFKVLWSNLASGQLQNLLRCLMVIIYLS